MATTDVLRSHTDDVRDVVPSSRGRIFRSFGWLAAGTMISQPIAAGALIIVSRSLGPTTYGWLALGQAVAALAFTASDLGIGLVGTRVIATRGSLEGTVDLVFLRSLASFCLCMGTLVVVWRVGLPANECLLIVLCCISVGILAIDPEFAWSGKQRFGTFSALQSSRQILRSVGMIGAVIIFGSVLLVPVTALIAATICIVLSWALLIRRENPPIRISPRKWTGYLMTGLPIGAAALVPDIYVNTDAVTVSWIRGAHALGQFSVTYRAYLLVLLVAGLYMGGAFPALCQVVKNQIEFHRLISHSLTLLLAISIPIAAVAIFLGPRIVLLVYGSAYRPAGTVAPILLSIPILALPNLLLGYALIALGHSKFNLGVAALGGAINIVLDLLLLPRFGIRGAAFATALSELIVAVALWLRVRPQIPQSSWLSLALASAALLAVRYSLAPLSPLVACVGALVAYASCLTFMGTCYKLIGIGPRGREPALPRWRAVAL